MASPMTAPLSSQENLVEDPLAAAGLIKAPALASNHVSSAEESSVSAQPSLGANSSSSTAAAEEPTNSDLVASGVSGASKKPKKPVQNECKVIQETPYRVVSQPKGHAIDFPLRKRHEICFVCGSAGVEALQPCGDAACKGAYHPSCVEGLPSGGYDKRFMARSGSDTLLCPLHHCATCYNNERRIMCTEGPLEQCSQCETAWHADCRPAGCATVNGAIICPRHRSFPAQDTLHAFHCLRCNKRDTRQLVSCTRCLRSFHFECMKEEDQSLTEDSAEYRAEALCFWCVTGDYPVVGQPCMARQGACYWYPCKVVADEACPLKNDPNLGKLGYVAVEWFVWRRNVLTYSVLPYNRLIAMTESDFFFTVLGDNVSYAKCYEAWKQVQAGLGHKKYATKNIAEAYKRASAASATFKSITANQFDGGMDRKALPKKPEVDLCICPKNAKDRCGPGSGCLNRTEGKECPKACDCNNRFIANKHKLNLEKFLTPNGERGYGLRAKQHIVKDAYIGEYIGEVITDAEKVKRMEVLSVFGAEANHYFMTYAKGLFLDAKSKGNIMRFANHSCEPNAELVKVWSDGRYLHIVLRALKDIADGDEITFDYNWGPTASKLCRCHAPNCSGIMSSKTKTTKTKTTAEPKKAIKSTKADKIMANEDQPSTSKASAPVQNKRKASSQPSGPQSSKRSKTAASNTTTSMPSSSASSFV